MDMKSKSMDAFLDECMGMRLEQLANALVESGEYKGVYNSMAALFHAIEQALPDEVKPLLAEYNDQHNQLLGLEQAYFYKQGFSDVISLIRLFAGNGEDVPESAVDNP